MATNPPKGDGHRNGAVRNRTQVLNQKQTYGLKEVPMESLWMVKLMEIHLKVLLKRSKIL